MSTVYAKSKLQVSVEETSTIKEKIFENVLPEYLFELIFSQKKTEAVVQKKSREWEIQDNELLSSKIELVRFRFFVNSLTRQIENMNKQILDRAQQFAFQSVIVQLVSMPGMFNYKIDPSNIKGFIREQRQYLIEVVSLLPTGILDLKLDEEVALPFGLSDPNLMQIIWNASYIRKASGNNATKSNLIDLKMRVSTMGNCLSKICELGDDDWKIVANIIEDEKLRSLALLETVKKLISKNKIDKAKELAKAIPDPEIKKTALNKSAPDLYLLELFSNAMHRINSGYVL